MADASDKIQLLQEMRSEAERETVEKRFRGGDNGGNDGGEPPMSNLEARVQHLETDMRSVRDDLAVIKATYATRDGLNDVRLEIEKTRGEMHSLGRQMIMWNVGTILTAAGLVFAIMRLLPTT
ncbi:hypothetical protein ACW17M_03975 [Vreelandella sp. 2A-K22]